MTDAVIARAIANPDLTLTVLWADHSWGVVDFNEILSKGPAFAPLRDPGVFAAVRVIDHGEAVGWPGEIEVHADTLRRAARSFSGLAAE